jgi:sugar (pentulose or hexulose) kinase
MMARACGRTVKVPTSGSAGAGAAAAIGSLQPASSGAIAANIKTMHADRVRSPDIES